MSIDNREIFPFVSFHGQTSRELGFEHGTLLADRIDRAIRLYREQFFKNKSVSEQTILNICEDYHRGISSCSSDYLEELNAIALASKQDPRWITALNCRLEILNHLTFGVLNECTVLYERSTCQLAENWDWMQAFEQLAFVNAIKSRGILQMTEPGVLGKVGLNSSGIGVTINFVDPPFQSPNSSCIPLHISLRAVLDQARTLDEAMDIFKKNGPGFGGHVLIGDSHGDCCSVEFPGDEVRFIRQQPYHTNHFLSISDHAYFKDRARYQNSIDRYERVKQLCQEKQPLEKILFDYDDEHQRYPICRSYQPTFVGPVGTVCSLIMNLKDKTMKITKGNPRVNPKFHQYQIKDD